MNERINSARLRWRCRRGMRELDSVLEGFLAREFDALTRAEKALFADILELTDPQLYAYLAQRRPPEDPALGLMFDRIRASIRPAD